MGRHILPLDQCLVLAEIQSPHNQADLDGGYWVKSVTVKSDVFKYYFILPHSAIYITVCDDLR